MKIKLPSLRLGLAAEHDCNKFALKWLESHGIETEWQVGTYFLYAKYPEKDLASYELYNLIKYYRIEFKKNR
jgi:hypothetical protein